MQFSLYCVCQSSSMHAPVQQLQVPIVARASIKAISSRCELLLEPASKQLKA